jgi:uncharacterized protein (DUF302 family)
MNTRMAAGCLIAALAIGSLHARLEARAEVVLPLSGSRSLASAKPFETLWADLEQAVKANRMIVVAQASASRGAAARGVSIPGNAIVEVFRNDYAVRMLEASVAAGYEAPLRFYLVETPTGSTLLYRAPTAVFAPYGSESLNAMAKELDRIFERIASDAIAMR